MIPVEINKLDTSRVLGLDVSTKSIAFSVMDDGVLDSYGKLYIVGDDIWEKAADANRKTYSLLQLNKPTHVAIESAVYVNNKSVIIKLSYIYGSIGGVVGAKGYSMTDVTPLAWGKFIDNPVNDKARRDALAKEYPDKSKSWLKNEARRRRKQYTMDWIKENLGADVEDDDVADAIAVAWYSWSNDG